MDKKEMVKILNTMCDWKLDDEFSDDDRVVYYAELRSCALILKGDKNKEIVVDFKNDNEGCVTKTVWFDEVRIEFIIADIEDKNVKFKNIESEYNSEIIIEITDDGVRIKEDYFNALISDVSEIKCV